MRSILHITGAVIFLASVNLRAQHHQVNFNRISLEEGLSQTTVHCILQDSKGFMWFGTYDGLNKFDGYTFKVFRPDPENPNRLSNNYVRSIYGDSSGVLWIGTAGGGLDRLDRERETFEHYRNEPSNPKSLSNDDVESIYEDRSGVLWIGTFGGGLNSFDRVTQIFTRYERSSIV